MVSPLPAANVYSDLPTNLTVHPVKLDVTQVTNADAIKASVRNLLLTNYNERKFQPDIGGNLTALLFELMTPITELQIKRQIELCIRNYEPRADIIDITVIGDPDRNGYNATITFAVKKLPSPVSISLFLQRVR